MTKFIPNEIKKLIDLIKEINDNELSNKAHTILNRRRDLLFSFHVDADYGVQLDDIVVNSLKTIINNYMKTKELKITPPEGYEIDKENSTFDCIKFKPIGKKWRDSMLNAEGYYIDEDSFIVRTKTICGANNPCNHNVFATKKHAKSAIAMARISQIMANDERFGGVVTDEEWTKSSWKYCVTRECNSIDKDEYQMVYHFLAFHTSEQRDLFLEENEDLVKNYLMIN